MKVLIDIRDDAKVPFIMEFLNSQSYIKAKPLTAYKARILEELKEAVENMALVKKGKLKARPARELSNEI